MGCPARKKLGLEHQFYGDLNASGDRRSVARGRLVDVLLKGLGGGFLQRRRARERPHGFDAAGDVDERVKCHATGVAGREIL